jgi:hypothetical protein
MTASERVRALTMSPDLAMPPSATGSGRPSSGGLRGDVERRELGDADAGDDPRRADRARALADLDRVGAAVREEFDAGGARDVARDERERGEGPAHEPHHLADARRVPVGRRHGDRVDVLVDQVADVGKDGLPVEGAVGVALRREGCADDEPELGVAGRLAPGFDLAGDPLDVGRGDQAAQAVVPVDDEHLVDADVGREELGRPP